MPAEANGGVEIRSGVKSWYFFVESYKTAADHLANSMERDTWRRHFLAAPMMFMYRHYIELHLKSLLLDAGELLDDPQTNPRSHALGRVWERVRALLLRISPESDGDWFTRADQIVREFDEIDPTSFAFRYPVGTRGEASLSTQLSIGASNVQHMIAELNILLDGASTQIDVYMDYKNEMRSEGYY